MFNGVELKQLRVNNKLPIYMIGDNVNHVDGGLFTVLDINWYTWKIKIHTRAKNLLHPMYRMFWCSIDDVVLSGTFHNNRMTRILIK